MGQEEPKQDPREQQRQATKEQQRPPASQEMHMNQQTGLNELNNLPADEDEMMRMLYEKYGIEDDEDGEGMGELIEDDDPINQAEFQQQFRKN